MTIPALKRRRLRRGKPDQRTFSKIDYYRLQNVLAHKNNPDLKIRSKRLTQLRSLLLQGQICPCKQVPGDLVTMNSVLRLQSRNGKMLTITLVYPREANSKENKCSVLSALGIHLIGKRQGNRIVRGMKVVEIVYQPESTGKFYV